MKTQPAYAAHNAAESRNRSGTPVSRLPLSVSPFPSSVFPSFRPSRRAAFTLIELLVVIAIVLMLAGLLLPAVALVRRQAKAAAARAEVKQIEAAWRQYYSTYEKWPSMLAYTSTFVCIKGPVAQLLTRGENTLGNNPRRLRLLDFKRLNADGSLINPWGDPALTDGATDMNHSYYCMFDMNYDTRIPDGSTATTPSVETPLTNKIQRTVVVWTVNPDLETDDPNYIIGSWQ